MEWRALAKTVPDTLALVNASVSKVRVYIDEARGGLGDRIYVQPSTADDVQPSPSIRPITAFERMGYASLEIAHHNELHNRAVRVFTIYSEVLDRPLEPPGTGALWQAWAESRDLALHRASEIPWTLCSAMSFFLASLDAMFMAVTARLHTPGGSPPWSAWKLAAEQLARLADLEASRVRDEEQLMRDAAVLEYMNASSILVIW